MTEKGPVATPNKTAQEIDALIKSGQLRPETILQELDNNPRITLQERDALRSRLAIPLAEENRELRTLANTDELTGLPNLRALRASLTEYARQLEQEEDKREPRLERLVVVYLDIRNFKSYNERFGHPEGDKVIDGVAQRIKKAIRKGDKEFRPHGDEFVIVRPVYSSEGNFDLENYINGLKTRINSNLYFDVQEIIGEEENKEGKIIEKGIEVTRMADVRVTIGYRLFKRGEKVDVDELLKKSDQDMLREKRRARRISDAQKPE